MHTNQKSLFKRFILALTGTIIVALCCFTPILAIVFGLIGLAIVVPYLDYILMPLLIILFVLTIISFCKWYRMQKRA